MENDFGYYKSKNVLIPIRKHLHDYGIYEFSKLSEEIDRLDSSNLEIDKIAILMKSDSYLEFLCGLTKQSKAEVIAILNEVFNQPVFTIQNIKDISELSYLKYVGDLRFHAISLYVIVRALKPELMIETGVAHGKSSLFILRAMEMNNFGKLISIDLPPDGNLSDGAKTNLGEKSIGWLVDDSLRHRWELVIGDSIEMLSKLQTHGVLETNQIFLHDSLHTFDHARKELEFFKDRTDILILMDNIEQDCGNALSQLMIKHDLQGFQFRDFGGVEKNK